MFVCFGVILTGARCDWLAFRFFVFVCFGVILTGARCDRLVFRFFVFVGFGLSLAIAFCQRIFKSELICWVPFVPFVSSVPSEYLNM